MKLMEFSKAWEKYCSAWEKWNDNNRLGIQYTFEMWLEVKKKIKVYHQLKLF